MTSKNFTSHKESYFGFFVDLAELMYHWTFDSGWSHSKSQLFGETIQNGSKRFKTKCSRFRQRLTKVREDDEREKKIANRWIFFSQKSELNARSVEAETELILPPAPTSRPVFSGLESGKARGPGPGCGGLPSKPLPKKVFRAFFYDTSELRLGQERRRRCLSTKHCEKLELGICGTLKSLPAELILNLFRQSLQIFEIPVCGYFLNPVINTFDFY